MKKFNKKGFTIVELVIVVAVIAILAAVLIPTFSSLVGDANTSKALQQARNLYTEYAANEVKYSEGEQAKVNVIVVVKKSTPGENGSPKDDGQYVVIKDGQVNKTVYKTEAEALEEGFGEGKTGTKGEVIYKDNVFAVTVN